MGSLVYGNKLGVAESPVMKISERCAEFYIQIGSGGAFYHADGNAVGSKSICSIEGVRRREATSIVPRAKQYNGPVLGCNCTVKSALCLEGMDVVA